MPLPTCASRVIPFDETVRSVPRSSVILATFVSSRFTEMIPPSGTVTSNATVVPFRQRNARRTSSSVSIRPDDADAADLDLRLGGRLCAGTSRSAEQDRKRRAENRRACRG